MQKNDAQYNATLNHVLQTWATKELQHLIAAARKAKIKEASGKSMKSFEVEVIRAATNQLAHVLIAFEESLRFFDLKNMNWKKQRPIDEIRTWIRSRGLEKFKYRYKKYRGRIPADKTKFLNAVAWAIVKGKPKKHRRRPWYNKQKNRGVGVLYATLLDEISTAFINEQKNTFK